MLACNDVKLTQYDLLALLVSTEESVSLSSELFPRLRKFRVTLPMLKYCKTVFRLNEPIEVSLYAENGQWVCENESLGSLAGAGTPECAVYGFCQDFAVLWEEIAKASDETLSPDAQGLKGDLHSLVKAVEKEQ